MKKSDKLVSSIITILLGILFIILKGNVISIAMTILGVVLIILGIIDITNNINNLGIIKLILGICVIVFGWILVSAVLYIIAALLLIYGVLEVLNLMSIKVKGGNTLDTVLIYLVPTFKIFAAICLLFNQGGTISWVFVVVGVFLIIEGILLLLNLSKEK